MISKIVPVVIQATGEIVGRPLLRVGTAKVSPPDENGKVYASVTITNTELLKQHKGLITSQDSVRKILTGEDNEERESS